MRFVVLKINREDSVEHRKPSRLFIAGTDTEVGKTYVTSLLAEYLFNRGHRVGIYKPVASGCQWIEGRLVAEDAVSLWNAAGRPRTLEQVCPQRFQKPLAPPQAAEAEGTQVDKHQLISGLEPWESDSDILLIEGAGGLFSPIADEMLNIDLAKQFNAELILIAENRLGAIHQVLSTCEAAKARDCEPRGIFLSHPQERFDEALKDNAGQIEKYGDIPVLGTVPHQGGTEFVTKIETILDLHGSGMPNK